ncbi:MAG: hypothetical protein J7515_11375 [Caulobacter sp.]|nr:hypothetical protein [Caulobacter sp.]
MFKTVLGVAAAATLAGALVPTMASAQAYGAYGNAGAYAGGGNYDSNGYYYDPCRRSTTQRGTGGGLAGAGIGAAIGSGVAAKGARTEGAVLGGLLGAIAGSAIGRNSAACSPGANPPPPPPPSYSQGSYNTYDQGYDDRYSNSGRYEDSRYGDRRDSYTYESERSYGVSDSKADANGCTLAESPIYLPDGRTQKRFVRVCPDASGRYQVVD